MAHYDLYRSLGLDRGQDCAALAAELQRRIEAGDADNPGGEEELRVAQRVLGDPARRGLYDQRLDNPNAQPITVVSLRDLAARDFGPTHPSTSSFQPVPDVAEQRRRDKRAWPWIAAGVVVLAAAGAGGYRLYSGSGTQPWEGENAQLAEAFPELVAKQDGAKGFAGMRCHAQEAGGGAQAKIRCADAKHGVSVLKYESAEKRDAAGPADGDKQRFGNDSCTFTSTELAGQDPPSYYLAPDGDLDTYGLLVNGDDAEDLQARLPIC